MLEFFSKRKGQKGFTLIELLVVIAIIGILATIVLVSLNTARQKARDVRRISDMRQIALALEMYYDSGAAYPAGPDVDWNDGVGMDNDLETAGYITSVPVDPVDSGTLIYEYFTDATNQKYLLSTQLEDDRNSALRDDMDVCTGVGSPAACDCTDNDGAGGGNAMYCIQP